MSGARRERDDPIALRAAIDAVASELGAAPTGDLDAVAERLFETVGPALGGSLEVTSLVGRRLTVVAADGRVASDLRYRADELTAAFASPPTAGMVDRIRVVVRRAR